MNSIGVLLQVVRPFSKASECAAYSSAGDNADRHHHDY